MKKLTSLIACLLLVAVAGCTSVTKTGQTIPVAMQVAPSDIKVDYNINMQAKKSGTASASYLLGFIKLAGPSTFKEGTTAEARNSILSLLNTRVGLLRMAALYNALDNTQADRLVDPQYECEVFSSLGIFKKYTVNVKGYEATITNITQVRN